MIKPSEIVRAATMMATAAALSLTGACSSTGTTSAGGTTGAGGEAATTSSTSSASSSSASASSSTSGGGGQGGGAPIEVGDSVLQHHKHPSRDGVYTQPSITHAAAAALHRDPAFTTALTVGGRYAQPLFLDGGATGKDLLFVANEENWVEAVDAATGATVWSTKVGEPVVKSTDLPCGNIHPLGITGTPVIDAASRTIFVDAMTTPDGGVTKQHLIHALSVDTGAARPGFPVDVNAAAKSENLSFDSTVQNQRGALLIVDGTLYVPYGGHNGDCGEYHGWIVAVPLANPAQVTAWATAARGGGSWAPGGLSSDGQGIFLATGNTFGAATWMGGEAIIRLSKGAVFSDTTKDYFAPTDWKLLDSKDIDIGGSGPVLFDLPGATPSKLALSLGKNSKAYLLDRDNLGGIGEGVVSSVVATKEIINAAVAVTTDQATYVIFNGISGALDGGGANCPGGKGGSLVALTIGVGAPPTITTAWCADAHGTGSPMVTTIDGHAGAVVWMMGVEGDEKLHGFDVDTGAELFAGGGAAEAMIGLKRFSTPIAAKGRIFAAGTASLYAFTPD